MSAQPETIPGHWYPVLLAERLSRRVPLGIKRLGLDVVLWRDTEGVAHAAHRGCPTGGPISGRGRSGPAS